MHVEGVSEGEKTPAEDSGVPSPTEPKASPPLPEPRENVKGKEEEEVVVEEEEKHVQVNGTAEAVDAPEASEATETLESTREGMTTPDPSRSKRRSRSRSRSRGSRDFKAKARTTQSPTPTPLVTGNDSSPEESPAPTPQLGLPSSPQLVQPIPSHFIGEMPISRLLLSPRLKTPDRQLLYPGISPPPSAPMTPMLPTLEALQKGLFRSNSAAARMMAMQKLTGSVEAYDQSSSAGTPPPLPNGNGVGRSNTVTGGERSAARQFLLRRLGERIKEEPVEQNSGSEEIVAPPPPPSPSPKRRRRRSRRGSVGASTAADEMEYNYNSTGTGNNTPLVPVAPLPFTLDQLLSKVEPVPRPPSTKPSRAHEHFLQRERENALARLNGGSQSPSYEPPRKRRSVVIEDEDDNFEGPDSQLPKFNLPMLPDRLAQMAARMPHASDAPSAGSMESTFGVAVPLYLSPFPGQQFSPHNNFPTSPFGTPLKEEKSFRDEDEEQVLYQADNYRAKSPFHDAYDREISWIAEPGKLTQHCFATVHVRGAEGYLNLILQCRRLASPYKTILR